MYPTAQEKAVIAAAEKMMIDTMSRYDPSHDAYHGAVCINKLEPEKHAHVFAVQRVRKTALTIAQNLAAQPDLLVVELGTLD
jgi:uncharacterized protein